MRTRLPVVWKRPTAKLHPEAADWVARVQANGSSVSATTADAVSAFCGAIDAAGIRDRFFRLNLFCGTGLNACLVPLYRGQSLGGTQFGNTTDTNSGGLFVANDYNESGVNGGLLGDGSSKYLNTGFNVSDLPSASNCHLSSYIRGTQDIQTVRALIGALFNGVTDRYRLLVRTDSSTYPNYTLSAELGKSNSANQIQRSNTNGGLIVGSRTSTSLLTLYDDGVSVSTIATDTSETTSATPFLVFARTGPVEYYNNRMAGYSIGAGMSQSQVSAYYTAMQAFQTALTRNV